MLSVIIPARNEVYLERTIRSVLDAAEGDIEVIAIFDGYIPDPQIDMKDNRVISVHYPESIGQRQAINEGARRAKGEYIMKLDAHCNVDKGFDVKLAQDCEYEWTVIPRMYNLNHETWEPKLHKRTDYMYIGCDEGRMLRAEYYNGKQPKNDKVIDDIMCCMGPCFFMHKDRFWELGGMDEEHGGWGQMGVELACKAWLSGGELKVNKNTWFAHWFRGGGGPGFPYPISGRDQEKARKYSRDLWMNDKWPMQRRGFQWLIDKFNPPGWDKVILNIGSGTDRKEDGIINIDIRSLPNVDTVADARKLPYGDKTVDKIINTDIIEHFGRHEIKEVLKEWYRVLKQGGSLEIRTPDVGRTMDRWKDIPWTNLLDAICGAQKYPEDFHKIILTKETLKKYLEDTGFKVEKIKRFSIRGLPRMKAYAKKK